MTISKALEVNIRDSRVEVKIDPKYDVLQDITADFYGIRQSLITLLSEICHPYKNWRHIVDDGRRFALHHFNLFKEHESGPEGVNLLLDVFFQAVNQTREEDLRAEALDNILVYLQQVADEAEEELPRFMPALDDAFNRLRGLKAEYFNLIVNSFYGVKPVAAHLADSADKTTDFSAVSSLLRRYLKETYEYWLSEPDPRTWFMEACRAESVPDDLARAFDKVSHERLDGLLADLEKITESGSLAEFDTLSQMRDFPGHRDFVSVYERLPRVVKIAATGDIEGDQWLLIFLFHLMNISGLASIHERNLLEINKTLSRLIDLETPEQVRALIDKTFGILRLSADKYPRTAFNTILNMGRAIYRTNDHDLVDAFITEVVELGFQTPDLSGVGEDWQQKANEAHIRNIRVWLGLIEQNPRWSRRLLSSLIINLALFGIFIKDTDLFPRDITGLLNTDIAPVYNMAKQLCRLFPAYFNDIGAEGQIRDISTDIDEISRRKDLLVHYLRKQTHVESSPQTVVLIEAIYEFWRTRQKEPLAEMVPPDIYQGFDNHGRWVDGMHNIVNHFYDFGIIQDIRDLLTIPTEKMDAALDMDMDGVTDEDKQRFELCYRLYQKLYNKYHTDRLDLAQYVEGLHPEHVPKLDQLTRVLAIDNPKEKLFGLLEYQESLKNIILSPEEFQIQEDIYRKRHIAVDIPSMYGSYHESKFDALGLTFRLEAQVNTLFQELMEKIDLKLITLATLKEIHEHLILFDRALEVDGIYSQEFKKQLELLTHSLHVRGFSFTQYMDIFRGFSTVINNIVNDHFNNAHQAQLTTILAEAKLDRLLPRFKPVMSEIEPDEIPHRVTEIFLRDRIAHSLGLQQLDNFIGRILTIAFQQDHELPPKLLRVLLNFDPDRAYTTLQPVNPDINDAINLGAKGHNLVKLMSLGLPVPKGFIISTEVFRAREVIERFQPAREKFQYILAWQINRLEEITGLQFGNPSNPLLLSVRSGSSISQPGMLATYLNVGMNEKIAEGMARGDNDRKWFAWDCYRRFLQNYGMSHNLPRNPFDDIMAEQKKTYGRPYKREFSGDQMRETALAYKDFIRSHGIAIEEQPLEQLYYAVNGVFDSWDTPKARAYRNIMGISNDWGTAVTIMAMVYGNLSQQAGSGVFFTHNPRWSGDKIMLWGDFALGNQGEDVVSGLVETLPISMRQAEIEGRRNAVTLETHFPEIYSYLYQLAENMIYKWGYGPQEIEFTFESPAQKDFHLLQCRDMVLRERPKVYSFEPTTEMADAFLGRGIGVSGGGMTGRLVFSLDDVRGWRKKEPDTPLILGRGDTVPDDIREIYAADGLLTARGGSTSHAAIVAHRLNKACIVGCADMICDENAKTIRFGENVLRAGDWISIDGLDGSVYRGRVSGAMQIKERGSISS